MHLVYPLPLDTGSALSSPLPSALYLHMLPVQFHGGTGLCPGPWAAAGLWGTCMLPAGVKVPTLGLSCLVGLEPVPCICMCLPAWGLLVPVACEKQ